MSGCNPAEFRDLASMWEELKPPKCRDFYSTLPLMPGALELWRSLEHMRPTILTGLPRGNWAVRFFAIIFLSLVLGAAEARVGAKAFWYMDNNGCTFDKAFR